MRINERTLLKLLRNDEKQSDQPNNTAEPCGYFDRILRHYVASIIFITISCCSLVYRDHDALLALLSSTYILEDVVSGGQACLSHSSTWCMYSDSTEIV